MENAEKKTHHTITCRFNGEDLKALEAVRAMQKIPVAKSAVVVFFAMKAIRAELDAANQTKKDKAE